ncbi:hypothetical protein AND4_04358 [Vibrio sp. AND4]|nr:hypothetical protein AND4_04358 [Vibrio sp. AND4]
MSWLFNMVEGDGFEPSKAVPADLQSAPFGHSGTPPGCFYTSKSILKSEFPNLTFKLFSCLKEKHKKEYGGGGRIRTIEGSAGRFTVCSLWPLGNPSRVFYTSKSILKSEFPNLTSKLFLCLKEKHKKEYGGGGRIRTIEGSAGRFTVCSLWPLGNPSRVFFILQRVCLKVSFPT